MFEAMMLDVAGDSPATEDLIAKACFVCNAKEEDCKCVQLPTQTQRSGADLRIIVNRCSSSKEVQAWESLPFRLMKYTKPSWENSTAERQWYDMSWQALIAQRVLPSGWFPSVVNLVRSPFSSFTTLDLKDLEKEMVRRDVLPAGHPETNRPLCCERQFCVKGYIGVCEGSGIPFSCASHGRKSHHGKCYARAVAIEWNLCCQQRIRDLYPKLQGIGDLSTATLKGFMKTMEEEAMREYDKYLATIPEDMGKPTIHVDVRSGIPCIGFCNALLGFMHPESARIGSLYWILWELQSWQQSLVEKFNITFSLLLEES